jgi:hypothetical protein
MGSDGRIDSSGSASVVVLLLQSADCMSSSKMVGRGGSVFVCYRVGGGASSRR